MSLLIRTFLNPLIFYPASCGRGLKPLWRAVSKKYVLGVGIHWFRVDGRLIRAKKYAVLKVSGSGFNLGFIVWGRSFEWPNATSFLAGAGNFLR